MQGHRRVAELMHGVATAVATIAAAGILAASPQAWAMQGADSTMVRMLGAPVDAAAIASAVGDCVAKDGDVESLVRLGYRKLGDMGTGGQMIVYRREAHGPLLILPDRKGALRCWVMANPRDDKAAVVNAISAKLGAANRGGAGTPGWRMGDYSLTFDWSDEPGRPPITRTEVYKIPQETK